MLVPLATIAASPMRTMAGLDIGCSIWPTMTATKIAVSRHPSGVTDDGGGIRWATTA